MNRTARTASLLAALVLGLAACNGSSTDAADTGTADIGTDTAETDTGGAAEEPDAPADGAAVSVSGFRFDPPQLAIAVGDTVTWTNGDGIDHTATSGTPEAPDGTFDVDMPEEGVSGEHTFDEAGTFAYFCEIHESMQGVVVVD